MNWTEVSESVINHDPINTSGYIFGERMGAWSEVMRQISDELKNENKE